MLLLLLGSFIIIGCGSDDQSPADMESSTQESVSEESPRGEEPADQTEVDEEESEDPIKENEEQSQDTEEESIVDGDIAVHFIDVGQGNAVLIQQGSQTMLIDAGDNHMSDRVVRYLKNQGIEKVDYLIGTHPHADHIGGMEDVIDGFKIGTIIIPDVAHTTQTFENMLLAVERNDLKLTKPFVGDTYSLGEAKATIVAPNSSGYNNLNDYSVGIRIDFGSRSFLFTGDAERPSEEEMTNNHSILSLDVDVLLIPHHGSNSSSTAAFLEAASAKYGVIQVGEDNRYGHPHPEVLERLNSFDMEIYRNDLHGTVIVTSDGEHIQIETEKMPKESNAPPADNKVEPAEEEKTTQEGININTASQSELQKIIHIGPAYAEQIVDLRPFTSIDDLTRVNGIGDGRLKDIKDQGLAYVQ